MKEEEARMLFAGVFAVLALGILVNIIAICYIPKQKTILVYAKDSMDGPAPCPCEGAQNEHQA